MTGTFDHVQAHHRVVEQEQARVVAVRTDPADARGEMEHDVGLRILEQAMRGRAIDEVVIAAARHDHVRRAAAAQHVDDEAAEEAGAAGDEHALVRPQGLSLLQRFRTFRQRGSAHAWCASCSITRSSATISSAVPRATSTS
jgi:hypothetical protein